MALDLPPPDPTRLEGSPLELVVCQLRYETNPGVSAGALAAKIHDTLGGKDGRYPHIEQATEHRVTMVVAPQAGTSEATGAIGWRLRSADEHWTATVMPDYVALETVRYHDWPDFEDRFGELLAAVAEHVAPTFEQRLGLRYIDRIQELRLERPQDWAQFIVPELLGPAVHPHFGPALRASQQQFVLALGEDSYCLLRHGFVIERNGEEVVDYLLDYDLYREGGRTFDAAGVMSAAAGLSEAALQLFQASITAALRERLATP